MFLPFFPGAGAETGPFSPSDLEKLPQKVKTSHNNNIFLCSAKKRVSIKYWKCSEKALGAFCIRKVNLFWYT